MVCPLFKLDDLLPDAVTQRSWCDGYLYAVARDPGHCETRCLRDAILRVIQDYIGRLDSTAV